MPLNELRDQQFDIIVVGGGLLGAAITRDAAMRGYRTLILEKSDFGSGSTACVSPLMLGAHLFLESKDLKLLRNLELERRLHLQLAPHLIQPVSTYFLASRTGGAKVGWKRRAVGALHNILASEHGISKLKPISARKLQTVCGLPLRERTMNGFQATDCRVTSSQRLCLENLLAALLNGATASNYAQVVGILIHNRQIQGITAEDRITGKSSRIQCRCLINAAGPWSEEICHLADDRYISRQKLRRESYVVFRKPATRLDAGVIFQTRSGEQVLELAPWNDDLVLGPIAVDAATTQESMGGSGSDTNSLLSELAAIFSWQSLDRSCVRYAFTGWQVQAAESDRAAAFPQSAKPMIIDHGRVGGPRGLISVACSKWAYYRTAAALALDTAGLCLKRPATPKCNTQAEPLFGGNMPALAVFIDQVSNAARNYSLSDAQVGHLVGLYGTKSQEIFQWLKNTPELRETICSHQPDIKAQLVYGVEKEMAVTLGDIFLRRTVIGQTGCQGLDCAPAAAATLARHLNWSEARVRVEIDNYHRELESTYRK